MEQKLEQRVESAGQFYQIEEPVMKILHGYSILIVEPDLDAALDLQEKLTGLGARVLTAYGAERAIMHAESTQLSAAVVGKTLSDEARNSIYLRLSTRQIPVMRHDQLEGLHSDRNAVAARNSKDPISIYGGHSGQHASHPSPNDVYSNC
jgi:hypothetical protein